MGSKALAVMALVVAAFSVDQATKWLILNVVMAPPRIIEITPFFKTCGSVQHRVSFGLFKEFFEDWPGVLTAFKLIVASGSSSGHCAHRSRASGSVYR